MFFSSGTHHPKARITTSFRVYASSRVFSFSVSVLSALRILQVCVPYPAASCAKTRTFPALKPPKTDSNWQENAPNHPISSPERPPKKLPVARKPTIIVNCPQSSRTVVNTCWTWCGRLFSARLCQCRINFKFTASVHFDISLIARFDDVRRHGGQ